MKALREAGRRVPEDVSVLGFDGIELGQHVTPALSTIRVNTEALGAMALKTLIARATDPNAPYVTVLQGIELIKRDSVTSRKRTM